MADRPAPGVLVLQVTGELDMHTASTLHDRVEHCLHDDGWDLDGRSENVRHVVVDLAGVRFIGSHGVAALIGAAHRVRAEGGELWVAGVAGNRRVQRPLELMGVNELLRVSPSTRDLVAALSGASRSEHRH